MKLSRLLIAAVVLAGLSAALWWSNKKEDEKAQKPPENTAPVILSVTADGLTGLEIKKRDGEDTVLAKSDSGIWSITAPKPYQADQNAVSSVVTSAASLSADRLIDENATDLASYGLAPAAVQVDFKMKDGKTRTLLIGDS